MIMKNVKDAESLAIDILTFLTGISSRDGEKFPVLRKAVRSVTQSDSRGLLHVIDELRREDTPISRNIADHIDSFTDYDFAHLLFSDGTVENAISLDNQLNIIQVADLVLPDKDTTFEEYTTIELLSVSMLIVISTFALDFIHSDRSIFKIVDLDEAWAFLNVAQGETLSNKLVRAGRAMQAGVYFVTQSSGDVSKESLKNNIGLKFAFRSTDINEIKQTLEFFGIDKDDENNQKRLRDLENGQCLLQDLYGVSVWYRYTQSLKNCYTLLIPDRPYREMRWSDERKDKRCVHKKEDFPLSQNGSVRGGTLPYPAFTSGDGAHATGLVDDTINAENLYSKYPLSNYQLDFYVDNSWSWLPWNWLDGIGKSVQYGLYCITNFVWTISLYLSNATGYVVQEAYKLDFINDMADSIGKSIQTLAGVTENGFSSTGFYVGFLLLIILVVGMYVAYTGLIKRETSKALHAVINFVVVFILSASFIAYAPDYIKKINEFSSDISTASLDLGTKIMLPNSDSEGKDSVDLIRDSLFSIQVEQPWLLLQFGNSNAEEIGTDRVEALVSASPEDEDGKTREEVVKTEIEDNDNNNLTIPQVVNRLGMVFFLLFFNLGITIFVFLLTGMMLFSQILFIIFAMFLPISFLLSMIPSYESMAKQAIVRVFNTIMTRAGITLIVTVAFSISSMFYNISTDYPFFLVAFLQIVCFAGIYMKLGDLMSMFSLNAGDSQSMGRRIFRRPYLFMRHRARRMERRMARAVSHGSMVGAGTGAMAGSLLSSNTENKRNRTNTQPQRNNTSMGSKAGSKVGAVLDTKNKVKDKANAVKENIKDMPTQTAYAVYSAKEKAKSSVSDFKRGMVQEQQSRQTGRLEKQEQRKKNIADKRMELQKAQEARQARKTDGSATTGATRPHERPATTSIIPKPSAEKTKEVKRPATATTSKASEPVKTTVIKERPLSSGASDRKATQSAQPVHRQNVEKVVSQETRQNYTKDRRTKVQQTQTTEKNRNLVTKKGQKKK